MTRALALLVAALAFLAGSGPSRAQGFDMRDIMGGGPNFFSRGGASPLGARALYLGSTLYRIHGSNEPETIGQAVSSGCFRMTNEDVTDLYNRVSIGATVVVRN